MRKIKRVKIGDYVFLSAWGDKDPNDPWAIGCISEISETRRGLAYRVEDNYRFYKHCWKVTKEEGKQLLAQYKEKNKYEDRSNTGFL